MRSNTTDIVILIGLQASGKSTFYRTHFASTHELISKDLLRSSKAKNKEQHQLERVEAALQENRSVVIDNTNPTPEVRQSLIEVGHRHGAEVIGYYFVPDMKGNRKRNQQRIGKEQVPDKVLFITASRLKPPTYAEGFDRLYSVHIPPESMQDTSSVAEPRFIVTPMPKNA
jgi:predicted kinase